MRRQDEQIVVGRIVGLHGVQGWLKIESYTDPRENIEQYSPWLVESRGKTRAVQATSVKTHGKGMIARLEGINTRQDAVELLDSEIVVRSDQLPELTDGEYYWRELIGLQVINRQAEELGQVESLFETGANDVLVVKKGRRERLIPYITGQVVLQVDLAKGQIHVDWDAEL